MRAPLPASQGLRVEGSELSNTAQLGPRIDLLRIRTRCDNRHRSPLPGCATQHAVSSAGGTALPATMLDAAAGHVQHAQPFFLPDGRHFLYVAVGSHEAGATAPSGIYIGRLGDPSFSQLLIENASQPAYASGHLLFVRFGTVLAQPFEPAGLTLAGTAVPIAERVLTSSSGGGIAAAYSVSQTGVFLYQTTAPVRSQLTWLDRGGTPLGELGEQGTGSTSRSHLTEPARPRAGWIRRSARATSGCSTSSVGSPNVSRRTRPTSSRPCGRPMAAA